MSDPFAPLGDGKKPRLRVVSRDAGWTLVAPAPADALAAPNKHPELGAPTATWAYRDAHGALLGYVLRFDRAGKKEFRPLALWRSAKGDLVWRWALWPAARPLYGLYRLAARPDAPVIVCEGEKAADAAARLLPHFVIVTSPGGSNAANKADWSPLRGRRVTVWPDADEAGAKYASAVASACVAIGAASVAIAPIADGQGEGCDAADAEAEGWTGAQAEALMRRAAPVLAPSASQPGEKAEPKAETPRAQKTPKRGRALIALIEEMGVEFWHCPAKNAYASVDVAGHRENYRLESKEFARWVASRAYAAGMTPPGGANLADALRVFAARALNEGPEKQPFKRVGERDGKWYLDLGDNRWRVVEIGPSGWRILDKHELPIVRSQAMLALPEPEATDEGLGLLRGFVNADDDGFRLLVAWLLAAMCPRGPYPIAIINGEQGSAKSTLTKMLRSLVDPNIAPLRAMPKDETDLLISATHSHVLPFDNVSPAPGGISDMLCRISTGGGSAVRAKFTDGDEFVVYTKNPIILNGIPALASRPDLASRSIVVRLNPIPEEARKSEAEHDAEWAKVAPRVLAILLDILSSALRHLPDTRLARASRMADFERLIEAASPALDWAPGEFAEIYRANQSELDASAIEADPVAGAFVALVDDDHWDGWEGTTARLLELLALKVSESVKRSRDWPQSPISLGTRIERLKPVLRRHGISIERRHSGERWLRVYRNAAKPTSPDA